MAVDRIDAIEARLLELELRVGALDGAKSPAAQAAWAPPPPPVQVAVEPPPVQYQPWQPPTAQPGNPRPIWDRMQNIHQLQEAPRAPQAAKQDTEYFIGAKVLPWVGAMVVLAAVLFFVQWGFKAGWITPAMVFTGEILFCLGFIGLGQWKRNEKEQYGQILTGVGSCGLYLSLAGGHLVQNLFSGEVLVVTFMVLSFANLAYGLWSNSRAFLAIGILGGFSAALLPMKENKTTLNAILHVAILIPAACIAARKKWAEMSAWLWVLSLLAVVPLASSDVAWQLRVAVLYLSGLASVTAYAHSSKGKSTFDPWDISGPVMLFLTALVGIAVESTRIGAAHLAILGLGAASISLVPSLAPERKSRYVATGIAIISVLGPFCFSRIECPWIFVGLTLLAASLSVGLKNKAAAWFAAVELVLALGTYLDAQSFEILTRPQETWLIVGLISAIGATAFAGSRISAAVQGFTLAAMATILPLFGRLGVVTLTGSSLSPSPELSAVEALAVFALAAVGLAARTKWLSAVMAMWAAFTIALVGYLSIAGSIVMPALHESFLLSVLIATAAVGLPVATLSSATDFRKPMNAVAGVVMGLLTMRLAFVAAGLPQVGGNPPAALILAGCTYAIGAAIVSLWKKSDSEIATSWAIFSAAGIAYILTPGRMLGLGNDALVITGLLTAFAMATAATKRTAAKQPEIWHLVSLLGWVLFSRWVDVVLSWGGTDLHGVSTMTVAWIAYALGLLSLGFVARIREIRYWSLGVMFTTAGKIVLVDLAYTSIPFRVGVLLCLGILMLGGGYWYIRGKQTLQPR